MTESGIGLFGSGVCSGEQSRLEFQFSIVGVSALTKRIQRDEDLGHSRRVGGEGAGSQGGVFCSVLKAGQ